MTVNNRLAKSHGYYLQHAKEVCMVAVRDSSPDEAAAGSSDGGSSAAAAAAAALQVQGGNGSAGLSGRGVGSDVIFSERRGQSQKPEEIYELIEQLVPGGGWCRVEWAQFCLG